MHERNETAAADTLGWGVLGCGDITDKRGAPAIAAQEQSHLVAFHSRTAGLAQDFATRHGANRWTTDRSDLLADARIDAVYIATEHHRHCEDVLAAAEAGKHVLCEKPLANSVADCRRMIDACAANGVALQVAYYRRYYPKLVRMKELLDAGAIGEPVSAGIHLTSRLDPDTITPRSWRLDSEIGGGGALVDTGSHRLDLLCWMLGEPERVAAFAERREMPIGVTDMESLLIRMVSGVHVVTRHGYRTPSDDVFEVTGTLGTLSATSVDGPDLRLSAGGNEERWELHRHANVHFPLFDDFTRRILAGKPPTFNGKEGTQASRIIEAAYESARCEKVVVCS